MFALDTSILLKIRPIVRRNLLACGACVETSPQASCVTRLRPVELENTEKILRRRKISIVRKACWKIRKRYFSKDEIARTALILKVALTPSSQLDFDSIPPRGAPNFRIVRNSLILRVGPFSWFRCQEIKLGETR